MIQSHSRFGFFLLCILPSHYHVSVKPGSGPRRGRTPEGLKAGHAALVGASRWSLVCVFQGPAGASASAEGERHAAVRLLGAAGQPAGETLDSRSITSMCCPHLAGSMAAMQQRWTCTTGVTSPLALKEPRPHSQNLLVLGPSFICYLSFAISLHVFAAKSLLSRT